MEMDIENGLPSGWETRIGLNGRLYYYSKQSRIVQILPPPEIWRCAHSLPYGWEMAVDYDNKSYYVNHITQTVTYEDPRTEDDQSTPYEPLSSPECSPNPQPRECEILRDPNFGFGFIAGSEKPVVIRSVTPGGPSEGKLLTDDQIVKIGGENVMSADRERVIELIRASSDQVTLTVLQPNRSASSSFLNPAKKTTFRTMERPKVRFADDVIVDGQERTEGSSSLLVSPGVLRVELENNQSRSFRIQPDTTSGDAVAALCDKLDFKDSVLFSLVLTPPSDGNAGRVEKSGGKTPRGSTASNPPPVCSSSPHSLLIAPWDCLSKVINNPSVRHHSCHFRLEFMPRDFHELARNDPAAFKYLYTQCVNDVVSGEVYKNDLAVEELIKLAVIQMQELTLGSLPAPLPDKQRKRSSSLSENPLQRNSFRFTGLSQKLSLKYIEKEYGMRRFIPPSLMRTMQKDNPAARGIRKAFQQHLKASYSTSFFNQHPSSPIIPTSPILTAGGNAEAAILQLQLQYLKMLAPQHLFGGRFFNASMQALMESDISILVGHNYGISQMINAKTKMVSVLAEFQHVTGFEVSPRQAEASTTAVKIRFAEKKELLLTMEPQAAHNFALMVAGYCRVYGNIDMVLTLPMAESISAPLYFGPHKVKPSHWNYPSSEQVSSSAYLYCDFSEPITPAILSQDTPPLSVPPLNGNLSDPPSPPPVLLFPLDDEVDAEAPGFNKRGAENSDSNNNSSFHVNAQDDVMYEEIETTMTDSPALGKRSDGVPSSLSSGSPSSARADIESADGYLVPTASPPARRAAEQVDRSDVEGDRDWMDLMKALSTENRAGGRFVSNNSDHVQASALVTGLAGKKVAMPPPPSYPPPKRSESLRKENGGPKENREVILAGPKQDTEVANTPTSPVFSSFKPAEGAIKVFSLPRDVPGPANVGPAGGRTPTSGVKSAKSLTDIQDEDTRRKWQETEELIEYFHQRRREDLVGVSSSGAVGAPGQGGANFVASSEFDTPIVVADIAAGNKRLRRAEKAASKNRKSWAGGDTLTDGLNVGDSRPLSMSDPDLSSSNLQKKRGRSLFRRLFGERKRRSHSMYESRGSSSAYGRRKKRFRLPRFRFRRTFTLGSSKKDGRETALPTAAVETPRKPNRFRPFSGRKTKHQGFLVISEPCDGVRGVDLLPSGKYTVAGTMFSDGQARGSEVITLDSKRPSCESLAFRSGGEDGSRNESKSPLAATVDDTAAEVKLRAPSTRESTKRPVSFSTFHQAVLEGHAGSIPSGLETVNEGRWNGLQPQPVMDHQSSPCELSLTESSEALQEIAKARDRDRTEAEVDAASPPQETLAMPDLRGVQSLQQSKSFRPDTSTSHSVAGTDVYRQSSSLPPEVCVQASAPLATSTPIQTGSVLIKKRPSHKRPAPPPPVIKSAAKEPLKIDVTESKPGVDEVKSDWEDDPLFKRKSVESPSLMTEIFSMLESSKIDAESKLPIDVKEKQSSLTGEKVLTSADGRISPGPKADDVVNGSYDVSDKEKLEDTQRRVMYEMFYDEMMADNTLLTSDPEGQGDGLSDEYADSDDSETDGDKSGFYDVAEVTEDDERVILKSYENFSGGRSRWINGGSEQVTSSEGDQSDVMTNGGVAQDAGDSSPVLSPEHVNGQGAMIGLSARKNGSYSAYQNLITPPGYNRNCSATKRGSLAKKPPLPPKPIFH